MTRRSVGVTLSAMKSNQRWHSITPHSAVATSARLRARVVQSCHQDIRTRRSLITSLHCTLLAFTFLLLISSMPPEFYRKPISAPSGQLGTRCLCPGRSHSKWNIQESLPSLLLATLAARLTSDSADKLNCRPLHDGWPLALVVAHK